jgi:hypothetical protein
VASRPCWRTSHPAGDAQLTLLQLAAATRLALVLCGEAKRLLDGELARIDSCRGDRRNRERQRDYSETTAHSARLDRSGSALEGENRA